MELHAWDLWVLDLAQGQGLQLCGLQTIPYHACHSQLRHMRRQNFQANTSQETSTSAPDGWLVFEVTDTGCGIAKEGLHALFNDYVQASHQPPLHLLPAFLEPSPLCHPRLSRSFPSLFLNDHSCVNLHCYCRIGRGPSDSCRAPVSICQVPRNLCVVLSCASQGH